MNVNCFTTNTFFLALKKSPKKDRDCSPENSHLERETQINNIKEQSRLEPLCSEHEREGAHNNSLGWSKGVWESGGGVFILGPPGA